MWKLLIFPICAIAFFLVAFFSSNQFFYRGGYNPPPPPRIYFEELITAPAAAEEFTDRPVFAANPVGEGNRGTLLVDAAHRNAFNPLELTALLSRVSDRGYAVVFVEEGGAEPLAAGLRQADALLVVSPFGAYVPEEAEVVADFVEQGGKVVLVADPGRPNRVNSLSERLGVSFRADYLYNLKEHDSNFQEFYVRDFRPDAVTSGIEEMVFYYAGSIESAGPVLALTDENTYSSIEERRVPWSPLAIGAHRNVLAVHDLTFMIPPYNAVRDNDRLVANIADFLTEGERQYQLADYPGFLDDGVDIILGYSDFFDLGAELRQSLAVQGVAAEIARVENTDRDMIFLGLYKGSSPVARYLDAAGVHVGADTLAAPFTPGIRLEGTAAIVHHRAGDRDVLAILAYSPEGLAEMVKQLDNGDFRSGLTGDFAGVYKTE